MPTPVGPVPRDPDDPDLWEEWYADDDEDDPDGDGDGPDRSVPWPLRLVAFVLIVGLALLFVLGR